ncbi:MAG: toprim domain-containing protein [Lachnospiraceae bacterium]|nr:toprim domain-containing protein [Lachnospiraceae bacterium]
MQPVAGGAEDEGKAHLLPGTEPVGLEHLSLGGTAPGALFRFLEDHPVVCRISLCLDHDRAGLAAMERIHSVLQEAPELSGRTFDIRNCPPPASMGKDYNELLQKMMAEKAGRGGAVWQL